MSTEKIILLDRPQWNPWLEASCRFSNVPKYGIHGTRLRLCEKSNWYSWAGDSVIMIFKEAPLRGVYLIELEKRCDDRGFFARAFCEHEFAQHGLTTRFVQMNDSLSVSKGTLRGMHYQLAPRAETKMVRCVRGAFHDVVLDLRRDSPTFGRSFGAELTEENRRMMYVPKGFAHGYVTLTDNVEAFYLVDEFYAPELERGIRWNDPSFDLAWPIPPRVISDKDLGHPDFDPAWHLAS